jgi:hypothetical protein
MIYVPFCTPCPQPWPPTPWLHWGLSKAVVTFCPFHCISVWNPTNHPLPDPSSHTSSVPEYCPGTHPMHGVEPQLARPPPDPTLPDPPWFSRIWFHLSVHYHSLSQQPHPHYQVAPSIHLSSGVFQASPLGILRIIPTSVHSLITCCVPCTCFHGPHSRQKPTTNIPPSNKMPYLTPHVRRNVKKSGVELGGGAGLSE